MRWPSWNFATCPFGLAVIWLLNRPDMPALIYLYDHPFAAPVMAMLVRALPLSLLLLAFGFSSVSSQRLEAAALDGAGPALRLWRIALPERIQVVAVAWLAAFAQAAGDLSCSILVLPPGTTTLQFRPQATGPVVRQIKQGLLIPADQGRCQEVRHR